MTLSVAIARTEHTEALFTNPGLACQPFPAISRAFAPMVREQRFDVSEMAIGTLLQARAQGSDLVLLPVTLAARFQEAALLRRATDPFGPDALAGRRIGVRAYGQTTGLWLRGILQAQHGLDPRAVRWVTFEPAHVPGCDDPAWAERAPAGSDMLAMLRDGSLDAAIFGNDTPSAADLAPVFPDPQAAGQAFLARHGFMPVNHMLVARAAVARHAGLARHLMDLFRNTLPQGRTALDPAVTLALRYAAEQGLVPKTLTLEAVWEGLPPECRD